MEISIEFLIRAGQAATEGALREYAARRLSFALRPFTPRIQHVTVRLVDLNGPRRGVDAKCSLAAILDDGRQVFVEAIGAWPFEAITRAAHRLNESIRRELGRAGHSGAIQRHRTARHLRKAS